MYFAGGQTSNPRRGWEKIEPKLGSMVPCHRSLHAGAVWKDYFLVFGGYDGHHRVNDLYSYSFKHDIWQRLESISAPSPRDRHVATVYDNKLHIFGGFDGMSRVCDLHSYDLERNEWRQLFAQSGTPPTPRHSHAAVVYKSSMFIFGGYDGSYRNDFHEYNFVNNSWSILVTKGEVPRARYRGTCVVSGNQMILHGGHDGNRHLSDTHLFDFTTNTWSLLITDGLVPSPRDSHVAVIFGRSMFLYGGSTGSAMGDFHELTLSVVKKTWSPVNYELDGSGGGRGTGALNRSYSSPMSTTRPPAIGRMYSDPSNINSNVMPPRPPSQQHSSGSILAADAAPEGDVAALSPGARFCHVGVVYNSSFYIFGGYDGSNRLNDFLRYKFDDDLDTINCADEGGSTSLASDLKKYVNNELLSDVTFIVEGRSVFAHKILCLRCPFFFNMLAGDYAERSAREIKLEDVKYDSFIMILEYLYSDEAKINIDNAMELFQAADRFGLERLKRACEHEMLSSITIDTAAAMLFTANEHAADTLRERCMNFILQNFDEVSRTTGFEEMGRTNIELVFEVLQRR